MENSTENDFFSHSIIHIRPLEGEVIVMHEKLILAVGGPYGSTINDKISVKYSEFFYAMKEKLIGKDIKNKSSDVLIYPQSTTKLLIFITFYI